MGLNLNALAAYGKQPAHQKISIWNNADSAFVAPKEAKIRVVAIPLSLIPELTQQMQLARVVWERDQHNNLPVMLPHALARKYPEYQFNPGWKRLLNCLKPQAAGANLRIPSHTWSERLRSE